MSGHIEVSDRPYIMRTPSGFPHRLASEEVQRLVAAYPVTDFRPNKLALRGEDGIYVILPATAGGDDCFRRTSP